MEERLRDEPLPSLQDLIEWFESIKDVQRRERAARLIERGAFGAAINALGMTVEEAEAIATRIRCEARAAGVPEANSSD